MTVKELRMIVENAYDDAVVYIAFEDLDGNRIDQQVMSARTEVYDMGEGNPDLITLLLSNR